MGCYRGATSAPPADAVHVELCFRGDERRCRNEKGEVLRRDTRIIETVGSSHGIGRHVLMNGGMLTLDMTTEISRVYEETLR